MRKLRLTFLIALIVFISLFSFSFAQSDTTKINKWGCSIAINSTEAQFGKPEEDAWGYGNAYWSSTLERTDKSISLSIVPKYYINDKLLLRFEFCITNFNVVNNFNTKNNLPTEKYYTEQGGKSEQKVYRYVGGVQYNFYKIKRFETFVGVTVSYTDYKEMTNHVNSIIRDSQTDTIANTYVSDGTNSGGFSAGIGTLVGFNFYLQKHISMGAEFSSSLLYYNIGGVESGERTIQNGFPPPVTEEYRYSNTSYNGLRFSKIMPSLNFGVWF